MKVLYIDYNMFGKDDIVRTFGLLGFEVVIETRTAEVPEDSEEAHIILTDAIGMMKDGYVFTSNYYPMVSNICNKFGVKYISWTYDSPRVLLYDTSINNRCNYAFVFDSVECGRLRGKGANRVFYMPLGVATDRINEIVIDDKDNVYKAEVSLVASLYNEEHNLYDRLYSRLENYHKGYLDAVIQAQRHIFGGNILEESLDDNIVKAIYKAMPYELEKGSFASLSYVYANYFLARKTASYQRIDFIREVSDKYDMKVYTPGNLSGVPNAKHMGTVDYNTDMNKVFRLSKINLNITLPSIQSGIPLRAMDIMGAGGFLLTNYQSDFEGLFEPDHDYVYYTSLKDALSKIDYYLKHEDERESIAENGRKKIEEYFTYYNQVKQMLEIGGIEIQ